jgi:transposase
MFFNTPAYNHKQKYFEVAMKVYKSFIGIDIGKFNFVVSTYGEKTEKEYENTVEGIASFMKEYKAELKEGFSILETTGGYEMRLLLSLCEQGFDVHRANARNVKHFIQSFGNAVKTDKLDARALALYGRERYDRLSCFVPDTKEALALYELVQRRQDLKQLLVAEKNRLQGPRANVIKKSCEVMIEAIGSQIDVITIEIDGLIQASPVLTAKKAVLKTVPGIGEITATNLLVLLPELGKLSRREIASLAGLAPRANESGKFMGYRATGAGRSGIKPILFMSAMAARNSNSTLKTFYLRLVEVGKKKMVALTALMRKILVIANARLKEMNLALA